MARFGNFTLSDTSPKSLRALMAKARDEWGGRLTIPRGVGRQMRVAIHAYAGAYRITLKDENDGLAGGKLTSDEADQMARTWKKALNGQWTYRVGTVVEALIEGAVEFARLALAVFYPFIAAPFALAPIGVAIPLLYVLFGLAFGFATPFVFAGHAVGWMFHHPAQVWLGVRIFAGLMFAYVLFICVQMLFPDMTPVTPAPQQANGGGNGYGPYAIQDFREQSAFGDASLAQKQEIGRALAAPNDTHTPRFED